MGLNSEKSKPNLQKVPSTSSVKTASKSASQWLILLAIGFSMSRTFGTYGVEFVLFVVIAFAWFLANPAGSLKTYSDEFLLRGSVLFFLGRLWSNSSLFYAAPEDLKVIQALLVVAFVSFLVSLLLQRTFGFFISLAALSTVLFLVPSASPNPQIDVFPLTKKAIEYFLNGTNPYAVEYEEKLSTLFGYRPGYGWMPGALVATALASLISDFRWIFALSLILSAAAVSLVAWNVRKNLEEALLFGLLWLSFPVSPFVVEQAWVDPLLIVSAGGVALGLFKRNFWFVGLSLGFHLSVKQYGMMTLAVTALWLWKKESFSYAAKTLGLALLVFLTFTLPFFLGAPKEFLQMAIFDIFGQAPRQDSFTLYALLKNHFDINLSDHWTVLMILGTLGAFFLKWQKAKPTLGQWALCLFISTCLGFLFARRAFCNYFHFSSYFLVIYLTCLAGEKNESHR